MNRDALVREIRKAASARGGTFQVVREGASHQIFRLGTVTVPIPRHRELGPRLASEIQRQLEPELGERWWR